LGKLEIKTDVLAPQHELSNDYEGFHPSRLLKEIPELMKATWFFTSSKFFPDFLKWDVTGDDIEFFGQWRGRDPKDRFSDAWIKVKIHGEQNKKTKAGNVNVKVYGHIETTFETKNFIDDLIKKWFIKNTYQKQIKDYIRDEAEKIAKFDGEIRTIFEINK